MIFNLGDQFVYPSDTYDYGWYGILTIQRITENWVYLKSEYTGYDAEYRQTFDDRDLKFPIDAIFVVWCEGEKCYHIEKTQQNVTMVHSVTAHTTKGTCTWHEGVQGSATQSEYDASQVRVKYRSPKGIHRQFCPTRRAKASLNIKVNLSGTNTGC